MNEDKITKNNKFCVISVSPNFAKLIKNGYEKMNEYFYGKYRKKMTFIDFTDFLAHMLNDSFDLILTRTLIFPIKKGRKKIKFDVEPIL